MTSVDAVMAVTDVDEVVVPEKDRSLSQLTHIDLTEFFESWSSYNLKCVFQQNNLINILIRRIF